MIEAWFNERGYHWVDEKGGSNFVYDLPLSVTEDASQLYACRWMVLNHLMTAIEETGEVQGKDLVLYTDSRLIEELQGDLTPDSNYAKASRRHFVENDYVKYRRITFQKCAATTVNAKLSEPLHTE